MESARFDYALPSELIAQVPAERRDASRLMVVRRASGEIEHRQFAELTEILPTPARLFRNTAAVLKARLTGRRPEGGRVECLLLRPTGEAGVWWCLLKPGKKAARSGFSLPGEYRAEVVETAADGSYRVRFETERDEPVEALAERLGRMPLPPYIEREERDPRADLDAERYQTVYADPARRVAAAAPTAGLHFTPELIDRLRNEGRRFFDLTLNVGPGTFQPMQTERVEEHAMHREAYAIPPDALRQLDDPSGGPRVAIGTTSVRTLEDAARRRHREGRAPDPDGAFRAEADLFLHPPAEFRAVDAMITNFHLPRSTLLCMVAAFLTPGREDGADWIRDLYAEAVKRRYRFYSYGDAMLIL